MGDVPPTRRLRRTGRMTEGRRFLACARNDRIGLKAQHAHCTTFAPSTSILTGFMNCDPAPSVTPALRYVALLLGGSVTGRTPVSWLTGPPAPVERSDEYITLTRTFSYVRSDVFSIVTLCIIATAPHVEYTDQSLIFINHCGCVVIDAGRYSSARAGVSAANARSVIITAVFFIASVI